MNGPRPMLQSEWARLEEHFAHHASLVDRFSAAGPPAVLDMVRSRRNERGQVLSALEREALVERHCEIFGRWRISKVAEIDLIANDLPN